MRKTITLAAALGAGLLFTASTALRAQSLDPAFQPTVLKAPMTPSLQLGVNTLAVQPDGKYLVAGGFDFVNGTLTGKLQRFNPDGTADASFAVGTGANGFIAAALLQPDGKILVAGAFTTFNGQPTTTVVRLNANGTLDNTFAAAGTDVPRQPMGLVLQPDGNILVYGSSATLAGLAHPGIMRLLASGSRDATFAPGTGAEGGFIYAALVQPDGKIVVGTTSNTFNGQNTGNVARLNADGTSDTSFGNGVPVLPNSGVRCLLRQPSGAILVGGTFSVGSNQVRLLRLTNNGVIDNTFAPYGGPNNTVLSMLPLSSGDVLIGGTFGQYGGVLRGRLARISADGVLDGAYAANAGANATVQTLAVTSTGQVLLGGGFSQFNGTDQPALARLSLSGTLDPGFAPLIEARGLVQQALPLPSGQLLISGNVSAFNGTTLPGSGNQPRRLNADGTLDATYAPGSVGQLQFVPPTGAPYAGSAYVLDIAARAVRRLQPGGALDNSFATRTLDSPYGSGAGTGYGPLQLIGATGQPDGKVLAYGIFTSYDGAPRNGLVRLNPDGTLDASFIPPASLAFPATLNDIRRVGAAWVLPSGKILVQWGIYNGSSPQVLTRLNADGTLDNTFSIGTGPASATGPYYAFSTLVQPDGRILISSPGFTSFNGQYTPYGVTRLTTNGTVDPTFSGLNAYYQPRYVQADGKILATTADIIPASASNELVRLNADGSRDASFTPVPMPNAIFTGDDLLTGVTQQPTDGKLILYGSFRYVAGQPRIGLARLTNGTLATKAGQTIRPLMLYPNPAQQRVTVQLPADAAQLRVLDLQGRLVQQRPLPARQPEAALDLAGMPAGLYLVQVVGATGLYQQRVVVTP